MRATLDALYDAAAWVAAACMIGVLAMVLLSIAGRQFGFYVPGTDAYAGYLMAGSSFLALAHTLKRNEHIRVTLVLNLSPPALRRALQLWSLGVAVLLSGLLGWFCARLAWQSRQFHDISTGADATPLWIPQVPMAIGALLLFVAFVDELVLALHSGREARETDLARVE
ncbi:MAG: TRAP transporter small permease [Limnobacter sp.]|nr:TRAP transporter small permease [Limnobacter sp.]